MKRYDSYKDSGVKGLGILPTHWDKIKLKYIVNFINGYAFDSKDFKDEGSVAVFRIGDIKNNGVSIESVKFVDLEEKLEQYKVIDGDLLIAMSGATVGKLGEVKGIQGVINQRVGIIRSKYNGYIKYCLSTKNFLDYVINKSSGSAQPNISSEGINNYYIAFPPIVEQDLIAEYLDEKCGKIDALIEAKEKQITDMLDYRRAIISETVTRGLNPDAPLKDSGIKWIGKIPAHWNVIKLKHTCTLKGRIGWNGLKSDEFETNSYAYLVTGQDFRKEFIEWNKCYQISQERYDEDPFIQLKNGDLLVTKDGTIGKIAKVSNLDKPACLNSGIFVVKQYKNKYQQNYLYWLFCSGMIQTFNEHESNSGSTIQHLYQNVFENMPIVTPPLDEQEAIAAYLDEKTAKIDAVVEQLQGQIVDLKDLRAATISDAVTGKVDVRDWK